jgi:hypothetical protein
LFSKEDEAMQSINWSAAIKASIIAGLVFLILELVLVATVGGDSPWAPVRMIGAIALGEEVLPPPATFDLVIFIAATVVHLILTVLYGIIFALVADRAGWGPGAAAIAGAVFGLILYAVNFYGFTAMFPWFAMARNEISIFAHAVYGLVLGYSYRKLAPRSVVVGA